MTAKDVSQGDFSTAVLERSKEMPVVVDFWAAWCGPCRVLGPILEKVASEPAAGFELAKIDVDRNQLLASQFGIQGIPTVVAFKDGKAVSRFTGAIPEASVRKFVESLRPSAAETAVEAARDALLDGRTAEAEATLRAALAQQPDHREAALSLAALLLERAELKQAEEVLVGLPPDSEVNRMRAAIRLHGDGDLGDPVAGARALAAEGRAAEALPRLLQVVAEHDSSSDEARRAILDVFEVLGSDHPLTMEYRRRLANALF